LPSTGGRSVAGAEAGGGFETENGVPEGERLRGACAKLGIEAVHLLPVLTCDAGLSAGERFGALTVVEEHFQERVGGGAEAVDVEFFGQQGVCEALGVFVEDERAGGRRQTVAHGDSNLRCSVSLQEQCRLEGERYRVFYAAQKQILPLRGRMTNLRERGRVPKRNKAASR